LKTAFPSTFACFCQVYAEAKWVHTIIFLL